MKRDFLLMWLSIIGVSVHDGFLVLAHRSAIAEFELNPVGRWLLLSNGGDIWILLGAKTLGTLFAASILLWLYWLRPRLGWTVCAVVCLLQLVLLIFLYLPATVIPRRLSVPASAISPISRHSPDLPPRRALQIAQTAPTQRSSK